MDGSSLGLLRDLRVPTNTILRRARNLEVNFMEKVRFIEHMDVKRMNVQVDICLLVMFGHWAV